MSRTAVLSSIRRLLADQCVHEQSDEQLLSAFVERGEESAFTALVRRHGPMVLGVCRRVLGHEQDAEDAFQATFLVLAQRAASLRDKSVLASFLYGTAFHLASKAKRAAGRRRKHEGQAPPRSSANPAEELRWREVRTLLDEEIARLPDIYRSVFVLCCLDELSRAEAARRLGIKERTVWSRLAEARRRLQRRLSRRGVELTAALAASMLTSQSSSALPFVPLPYIAGSSVSPAAAALAKSALPILNIRKIHLAMVLLAIAASGSLVGWCQRASEPLAATTEPPAAKSENKSKVPSPPRQAAQTVQIHGRVFGPDGKPKTGAKLLRHHYQDGKTTELGVSAADGRFAVTIPEDARNFDLIAQADGAGIDFVFLQQAVSAKPIELRLVKDQPIRGRVVNTEGKPIRGARVAVRSIQVYPNNSLDSFLAVWKGRDFYTEVPRGEKALRSRRSALLPTTTDAEGRFVLRGIGAERLVRLHLSGPGIAGSEDGYWIVNRPGFDPQPYNRAARTNMLEFSHISPRWILHGPDLSIVAEAEKPIYGIVKDADNGNSLPNFVVHLTRRDTEQLTGDQVVATTDAQGRFRMHGVHKSKRYMLEIEDDPSTGYKGCQLWIGDTTGYDPIAATIRVKKGVILTGRVIDRSTGRPVSGFVLTDALLDNAFAKNYPPFHDSGLNSFHAAEDGRFRVVAIPGAILLMGGAAGGFAEFDKYRPVAPDPQSPQYFTELPGFLAYKDSRGGRSILEGNTCKVLHLKPGAAVIEKDIVLEPASALAVNIEDAEGRPLSGVWATGISSKRYRSATCLEQSSCAAYHLEESMPRLMVFYHPERKLAGSLELTGKEKAPVAVRLHPTGAIKGRLFDADGKPLAGVLVEIGYRDREAEEVHRVIHKMKPIVTDAAGAFAFSEMIPGRKFFLQSIQRGQRLTEEGANLRKPILHAVKSGECRDLGAIRMKQSP